MTIPARVIACIVVTAATAFAQVNVAPQGNAPAGVVDSAVKAVKELGRQVELGNNQAAIDSMYPQWKDRMAIRHGSLAELERRLDGIAEEMNRNGISILSVKVNGVPRVYEVWPGKADEEAEGGINYTKWLVMVPTVTRLRIMLRDDPEPLLIDSHSFQVAISDKGENNWTFINGSDITVPDLRSLFITLPQNMKLPEVKREQVKD